MRSFNESAGNLAQPGALSGMRRKGHGRGYEPGRTTRGPGRFDGTAEPASLSFNHPVENNWGPSQNICTPGAQNTLLPVDYDLKISFLNIEKLYPIGLTT